MGIGERASDSHSFSQRTLQEHIGEMEKCKTAPATISPADLIFATRFIATVLFIHVKGTLLMTYQYLTVEMFYKAKSSKGFIDQKSLRLLLTISSIHFYLIKRVWI